MCTERYNSEWNVNMRSLSPWTASHHRRRHCSHSASLRLPGCDAVNLHVQKYRSFCHTQLPETTCCTGNESWPGRGLFNLLTPRIPYLSGSFINLRQEVSLPSKGKSSGLSRSNRITWSRHQSLFTNLDLQRSCKMNISAYSKRVQMVVF